MAKNAPMVGPIIKPKENATPTKAMARLRIRVLETSVIMDMAMEMLPLLKPPIKRAKTNIAKFRERAHNKYDKAIPN